MCVSLFAKPRVDNQGSWKEMENWKKSLRGAVGTADSIYLQQQGQNALFANGWCFCSGLQRLFTWCLCRYDARALCYKWYQLLHYNHAKSLFTDFVNNVGWERTWGERTWPPPFWLIVISLQGVSGNLSISSRLSNFLAYSCWWHSVTIHFISLSCLVPSFILDLEGFFFFPFLNLAKDLSVLLIFLNSQLLVSLIFLYCFSIFFFKIVISSLTHWLFTSVLFNYWWGNGDLEKLGSSSKQYSQ